MHGFVAAHLFKAFALQVFALYLVVQVVDIGPMMLAPVNLEGALHITPHYCGLAQLRKRIQGS